LIAELPLCGGARFRRPHPGLKILFHLHLQVKLHLFRQLTVEFISSEDRFKDTRPIWQAVNERRERIELRLDRMDETMQMLAGRELEFAAGQSRLSSPVTALERARENDRRID